MKFSEMKAQLSGLPEGFDGQRAKYQDVTGTFIIVKACLLREVQLDPQGEVMCSPVTGKPYFDWNLALQIRTEHGELKVVRTNSPTLIPVFRSQIGDDRKADSVNRYGAEIFNLDPPEGKLRFTTMKHDYKSKGMQDVAYLEEAD